MAYCAESLTERLERIKKQNAEIRLRHLEVEADKKMAKLSRALVQNHVTTSIKDMMPAERDAILNKNDPVENTPMGKRYKEKPKRYINNIYQHTLNTPTHTVEKKATVPSHSVTNRIPQYNTNCNKNVITKPESDDDEDEGDLFKNFQDLKSDDIIVSDEVRFSGGYTNHHGSSEYVGPGYLVKDNFVPDCQKRLDAAVPVPSGSTPFFQYLSNINFSIPPPNFKRNIDNTDLNPQMYSSDEYTDVPNRYVPYTPLVGPNMENPEFGRNPLHSERAPYPRSVVSRRSSPPCALLPPSNDISQHVDVSGNFSNFQQDFSDLNEISAHAPDYNNELPSIQLLEKALHAMGGKGLRLESQNHFQRNDTTDNVEGSVNLSELEIPKEVASDLLKKALAVVNNEKLIVNSDITGDVNEVPMLKLVLQSEQNPRVPSNGRAILGRGARDQNVGSIEHGNAQIFLAQPFDPEIRQFPGGYQNAPDDQNSNNSEQQKSHDQENHRYRPILGRTAAQFEKKTPSLQSSLRQLSNNNKSMPVKKSNLLARMEAARNDTSHRFSRSSSMSQQNFGTVQLSYQGRVIQSMASDPPSQTKRDSPLFHCSDVREKDKQISSEAKTHDDLDTKS